MQQQKQAVDVKSYHVPKITNNSLSNVQRYKMEQQQLKVDGTIKLKCDQMIIDVQEVRKEKREWVLFSIPVRNYIASIQNQAIVRASSRKGNTTTWVYKCKADFLTAYNHTFAVYLAGLLVKEFDIMAQVVSLPNQPPQQITQHLKSSPQQHQNISGYQMVYRFDKYEPVQDKTTNQTYCCSSQQQPMMVLLQRYISQQAIRQVLINYKSLVTQEKLKQLQTKLINSDYQQQLPTMPIKTQNQNQSQPEFAHLISTSSTSTTSNTSSNTSFNNDTSQSTPTSQLNKQSQKFQFYVQHTNRQDQLDILIFEINLLLTLHLKQYHLYHDFKDCGEKFTQMLRAVMGSYPWFVQYSYQ